MHVELTPNELLIICHALHDRWSEFTRDGTEDDYTRGLREVGEKLNVVIKEYNDHDPEPNTPQ